MHNSTTHERYMNTRQTYKLEISNVLKFRVMVFNAAFNNISVISWWSILMVEETGENHEPTARLDDSQR
jgi:hypothetical protein